jgi:quercetin dioxygenase-like cupin family protein
MRIVDFSKDRSVLITEFQSSGAYSVPIASGSGDMHVYQIYFEPGGRIGPHPAGFDQLFLVVSGSGWIAAENGHQIALASGQGAYIQKGEIHSKGSVQGMVASMIQATSLIGA